MTKNNVLIVGILLCVVTGAVLLFLKSQPMNSQSSPTANQQSLLSPEAYRVMFEKGTEPPFSSPLNTESRKGTYVTADTGLPVYRSEDKFDSGTGWPSFVKPIEGSIELREDNSLFSKRIEVVSKDTGAHLGHVFDDGPADRGGKRYCMNGVALRFIPD